MNQGDNRALVEVTWQEVLGRAVPVRCALLGEAAPVTGANPGKATPSEDDDGLLLDDARKRGAVITQLS